MAHALYKPAAEVEVAAVFRDYEGERDGLGVDFLDELLRIEGHLSLDPALYQKVGGDVRRAVLRRFPYGLFYAKSLDRQRERYRPGRSKGQPAVLKFDLHKREQHSSY